MTTETEAKQKECPIYTLGSMLSISAMGAVGRDLPPLERVCCSGKECNLWRWAFFTEPTGDRSPADNTFTGYCGLGGKP